MKIHSIVGLMLVSAVLISCASNKKKAEVSSTEETIQTPIPIPVGAVQVSLKLVDITEKKVTATVLEVLGYGATSKRVQTDAKMELEISSSVYTLLKNKEAGTAINAEITHSMPALNSEGSGWRIIKILD